MLASLLVSWLIQWFLLQYGRLRLEFDSQCELEGGASGVLALSRLLLIFYQRDSDHHRLVSTPPSSPHLSHSHPPLLSPSLSPHFLFLPSFFLSLSIPHPSLTGEVMPEMATVSSRPIFRGVFKLDLLVPSLPCACALLSLSSLPFPLPTPCPPTPLARSVY